MVMDAANRPPALANQVRLVLHTAAYWLLLTVRDVISRPHPLATAQFMRLAWRVTKIATSASSPQDHNTRGSSPPTSDPATQRHPQTRLTSR